jgi:hypothetical protein
VKDGVTLTIEAGTIIKGAEGSDQNAAALIVAQGGKIDAQGTSDSPIVFTSVLDNIAIGETSGSNLDENEVGLWGGLLILGKAPISAENGDVLAQIEGIEATATYGAYGGSISNDNSGVVKYISIRHGGALIGDGNEINGFTLGGVGSGTTIDHVEVFANKDDGIELFGGTVNITNAIVGYVGDDAIDIDQNYSGTITNFVVITNSNSDEGLEIDGPENSTYQDGLFKLKNGSVYSKDGGSSAADFKAKAQGTLENVKFSGYTDGKLKIRASYQNDCADSKSDAYTNLTAQTPTLVFTASEFSSVSLYTSSKDNAATSDCTVKADDQTAAEAVMISTTATGATSTVFTWTWMSEKGKM